MKNITNKRRMLTTLLAASAALVACTRDDAKPLETSPAKELPGSAQSATTALVAQVGVESGPVKQTEGPEAVLVRVDGDVEVRRLGEETFAAAKKNVALYLGDQVRAGSGAAATILFPDESTAELAEVSTLAIGSRMASADPASSAAVLGGVSRFSVSPRAPGEGPFLVFCSGAVVATKGTLFAVGVAADGAARVAVESGVIEIAGAGALDTPLTLEANTRVALTSAGKLGSPAAWPQDDWGSWRDQAEANVDVAATAVLHAEAMTAVAAELNATYGALAELGSQVAAFEVSAAAQASTHDTAGYRAGLPEAAIAIDASFLAALRLEYLTHAYLSHAVLASELYVRHPKTVVWTTLSPQVQAAVLWPKRLDIVATAYLEPLRAQYYLHHPRGRAHAQWVGVAVPSFYAGVTPPEIPSADVKMKLKFKAFTPPAVKFAATGRPIWIAAPSAKWHAKAEPKLAPPRGKLAFWVRPPQLKAKAILGASVEGKIAPAFALRPPAARGQLKESWGVSFGHKSKLSPPDLKAAAEARAAWKADVSAPVLSADLNVNRASGLKEKLHGRASASAVAKLNAQAKADAKAAKAQAKAHAKAKGAAAAKLQSGAHAAANLKVKVKVPEIKPPKLKGEAKAGASFKLGT